MYPDGSKDNAGELLRADRVDFITPADYTEGGELDAIVKDTIKSMAANDSLTRRNKEQLSLL